MKILLIQLFGRGGTQLYLSRLVNALSENENEIAVILGSYLFDEKYFNTNNIKIILFSVNPSYFRMILKIINPLIYYRLIKIITCEKPDIIHVVFEDTLVGIIIHLLRGRYPIVLTEHDPSPHLGESLFVKINWGIARFLSERSVDAIIVHGEKLKNILNSRGISEEKIQVIPHGDYTFYKKWKTDLQTEKKSILFFGLIREYKGLDYLLKAILKVNESVPGVKLIIAGDGDLSQYENLYSSDINYEIYNYFIPDEDVASFFQRASIVVLPYIDASQSGVVPIAYAFKKPVIVTNVGSVPEVVDDGVTGVIIPPKDVDSLANAIIQLLIDDNLRTKMGESAYHKMKNELSWDSIANKTVELYLSTIHRK